AVAEPELHLLHAAPLVRVRLQRLAEERQILGGDGQFARLARDQRAVHAEQVAQVEQLRQLPADLAYLLLADHDLDEARPRIDRFAGVPLALQLTLRAVPRPVADLEEMQLARGAAQDQPAGGPDARRRRGVGFQAANVRDGLAVLEPPSPGVQAQ